MFNLKRITELECLVLSQQEIIDALLDKLDLSIDECDCCGDLVLVDIE